MPLNML